MALVAVFMAATVVMTWPYVNYRALGQAQYEGDARLIVWTLAWANRAVTEGLPFFRSNLYFPAADTLRHNEHLFGVSVFTLPLHLAGVSAVAAHNVVWWLSFPANGLAAYVWVRRYVRDRLAAVLGGLAFSCSFYVMLHAHAHLQLIWLWGVPASLVLLERWFDRPTPRRALAWAAVLTLQLLTSWYLAVIAAVANAVQALVLVRWPGGATTVEASDDRARSLGVWWARCWQGAAASAIVVACVWPFARHYVGLSGSAQAAHLSADVASYLVPPANTLAGRWWLEHLDARPRWIWGEQTLFAGWTVLALATVGLVGVWRNRRPAPRGWVLVGLTGTGFLLSLGPSPSILPDPLLAPFTWLSALPGVEGMRAPARFAVLVTLGLGGLAALGADRLLRGGSPVKRALVATAIPVMLAEWFVVDFPGGTPQPLPIPAVYRSAEVRAATAVLSLPDTYGTPQWYTDTDYLYYSTAHWRPIVNGFGRDAPPGHGDLMRIAHEFPASAETLRAFGVQYVIVHTARYSSRDASPAGAALQHAGVRLVQEDGGDYLFELIDPPPVPARGN